MFDFFQSLGQKLLNGIISIGHWFGDIITNVFNALKTFITTLFAPLILLLQGIWYLIISIFNVVVLVIKVVLGLFYVVGAVIGGILQTFSGLMGFSGSTSYYALPSSYQQGFSAVIGFLDQAGFNTAAYVAAAFVWMATAYAVVKIAGGEK